MYYFRDPVDNHLRIINGAKLQPAMKACVSSTHDEVIKWSSFIKVESTKPVIFTVRSLRDVMFEFVVKNLNLVESFVGLPEMIIEEIFASEFSTSELKKSCLHLAINAFPSLVQDLSVSCQNLAAKTLCDSLYIDATCERLLVREIDISRDMLTFIAQFQNLTVLQLDSCRLYDGDIRLLANASFNPLKGGLNYLELLSLCCNHNLTAQSLILLKSLTSLNLIRVCGRSKLIATSSNDNSTAFTSWDDVEIQPTGEQFCERDSKNWLKTLLYEDSKQSRIQKENINHTGRNFFTEDKLSKRFYEPMLVNGKRSNIDSSTASQRGCDFGLRRYLRRATLSHAPAKKDETKKRKFTEISASTIEKDLLKAYL